ncbi:MAG: hypothetical protein MNSN_01690 [Minisyncoccus archaeiphilus]|uniref:hypothetical protein n=1 Tax=Minisyncoccus archaeiphilus TaxID=3238481 RepID=UPI002B0642DD|nr:MAG: hypothetical protein MNSN_01690 [Candidatus Parcubacteria bacterium]
MKKKVDKVDTIEKRIKSDQKLFIEAYRKSWTITSACLKVNISRETYYNWIEAYPDFKQRIDDVNLSHCDFAETQLVKLLTDGDKSALFFWLRHKHPDYMKTRVEVDGFVKVHNLTPEQEKMLKEGLKHAGYKV